MTKNLPLSRSATSAIAAFLALSTPTAFAQEAPVVPMTPPVAEPAAPPTVQPPSPTAPTAAPTAAEPAAPPPVIRVPTVIETPPAPKAAEPRAAAAPAREARPAPRQRAAAPAPVRARAAVPTEPTAPVLTEEVAPIAAPVAKPVQPIAEPAPVPVEKVATGGDSFPWEIAGGLAALLVAGAAGFALMHRRRAATEVWEFDESHRSAEWVPSAEPAFAREEIARADIAAASVAEPVPAQPVTAAATGFTPVPTRSMGRHEALAMAGPTPDNPFTTLSKRLARARFLDRQERADYDAALATSQPQTEQAPVRKPVSAWEISQRQTVPAPAEQEVRRLQPGGIRKDLKPGWTRN
ncbi:hypothetical protein [Sphingopyxis sp. Geo48]|uniref:hypothetical protein n=1 Tax=Sphingopyxis sp. Geo48 TaxID=545241 RepID=UPI0024B82ADE|nr:hypothetical protein [Sphingopyxis sp. Geo48]